MAAQADADGPASKRARNDAGKVAVVFCDHLRRRWHVAQVLATVGSLPDADRVLVSVTVRADDDADAVRAELEAGLPDGSTVSVAPRGEGQWGLADAVVRLGGLDPGAAWALLLCDLSRVYHGGDQLVHEAREAVGQTPPGTEFACSGGTGMLLQMPDAPEPDPQDPEGIALQVLRPVAPAAGGTARPPGHHPHLAFADLVVSPACLARLWELEQTQRGRWRRSPPASLLLQMAGIDEPLPRLPGRFLCQAAQRTAWFEQPPLCDLETEEVERCAAPAFRSTATAVPLEWMPCRSVDAAVRRRGLVCGVRIRVDPGAVVLDARLRPVPVRGRPAAGATPPLAPGRTLPALALVPTAGGVADAEGVVELLVPPGEDPGPVAVRARQAATTNVLRIEGTTTGQTVAPQVVAALVPVSPCQPGDHYHTAPGGLLYHIGPAPTLADPEEVVAVGRHEGSWPTRLAP